MNQLTATKRSQVIAALVEGNSIRATVRITGVAKNTIVKLLAEIGKACQTYHDMHVRNLPCKRVQSDGRSAMRSKRTYQRIRVGQFGFGDVWTWTAMCADTKLICSYKIGTRGASTAYAIMHDLASRLSNRIQLTTDGHRVYADAVESAFGGDIDYAMLVKVYGDDRQDREVRYSPAHYAGCRTIPMTGNPRKRDISTSFVERQNLTMRMQMRRFTRLTNAFSKKVDNLGYAVALHFVHYNFCRVHQTLRVTPRWKLVFPTMFGP
jgi:IS1 family transposase